MKKTILLIIVFVLSGFITQNTPKNQYQRPFIPQSLQFNPNNYQLIAITVNNQMLNVRSLENISYLTNPVEPDYQVMNIYIPESYFMGGIINGYTAHTAPIFFPNGIGGYMPAKPLSTKVVMGQDGVPHPNAVNEALMRGHVVASSGARGRTLGVQGDYTGKAPAVIVDLKAAIRYLKANDDHMVG